MAVIVIFFGVTSIASEQAPVDFSHKDSLSPRITYFDKLLSKDPDNPITLSQKYRTLSQLSIEEQDFDKGEKLLKDAIGVLPSFSQDTAIHNQRLRVYIDLYNLQYDVNKSIDTVLQTALQAFQHPQSFKTDSSLLAKLCSDIAGMYGLKEDHPSSIDYYKRAIQYEKTKSENLGLMYNNLAYAYDALGYMHHVLQNYEKAQKIWSAVVPQHILNNNIVFQSLITSYIAYGDLKSAKKYLHQYEKYFSRYVNPQGKALDKLNENDSMVYSAFDYLKAHIEYYGNVHQKDSTEKYISLIQKLYANSPQYQSDFAPYVYSSIESYAIVQKNLKNFSEAEKWIKATLPYISGNFYQMKYYANLGVLYYDEKKYASSLQMVEKALTFFPENTNSLSYIMLNTLKAELLVLLLREKEGIYILKQVFTTILQKEKRIRDLSQLKYDDFHPLSSSRHISILIKSGKTYEQLFRRFKDVKDLLTAHNFYLVAADMFHQYYLKGYYNQELDLLSRQINDGLLRTWNEKFSSDLADVLNKMENNASQHLWKKFIDRKSEEAKTSLEKNTSYASFNHFDFDLKQLQATLLPGQVIVKYLVGDETVYAVQIEPQDLRLLHLGKVEDLKKEVSYIFLQLQNFTLPKNKRTQQYDLFSKQLVSPLNLDHAEHLTFVLDDFLNAFPMEILMNLQTMKMLKSVNYSYSLSLLSIQKKMHHHAQKRKLAVFAPEYAKSTNDVDDKRSLQFKNLVFAQQEAQSIVKSTKGDLFDGKKATKQQFLRSAEDYNLLHLAMHSVVDTQNYENSFLVFQDHEPLFYHELYHMQLPAQLVILSACNTGNGVMEQGEGLMSLSRAFTYAGVSSTIHSLWEVPDKETYDLMQLFYEELVKGVQPGEALLTAKKLFVQKFPLKSHPYYWSGFVLHGDVDMNIQIEKNWWKWMLAIICVGGLVYWMYKRKKHPRKTHS